MALTPKVLGIWAIILGTLGVQLHRASKSVPKIMAHIPYLLGYQGHDFGYFGGPDTSVVCSGPKPAGSAWNATRAW